MKNQKNMEIPNFIKSELINIINKCSGNFDLSREYFDILNGKYFELIKTKKFPEIKVDGDDKDDLNDKAIIGWFKDFFKDQSFNRITKTKTSTQYIDRISFLYLVYKYGIENRSKINTALGIADKYNINFIGIPSTKQGTYAILDKEDEKLFEEINNISTSEGIINLFDKKEKTGRRLLTNKSITLAGFMLYPDKILPLDDETEKLLKYLGFDISINAKEDYETLLNELKEAFAFKSLEHNQKKYFFNALSYMGYKLKEMTKLNELLTLNKNVILYGAPGTSKTHTVLEFIKSQKDSDYRFCQFHASFTYEDFMEGFKPVSKENSMQLEIRNGVFKDFVKKAIAKPNKNYYFIIDEINRAELSRVFGELLYCIEYRIKKIGDEWSDEGMIETQYHSYLDSLKEENKIYLSVFGTKDMRFGIPENVYIIGTMNSIDRSVDSIDMAMRRRFVWHEMKFDEEVLKQEFIKLGSHESNEILKFAKNLNDAIKKLGLTSEYEIGHTYFLRILKYLEAEKDVKDVKKAIDKLWELNIKPLVREYLRTVVSSDEIGPKLKEIYNPDGEKS